MSDYLFGIDLGGTKIEAILVDADGNRLWGERIDSPSQDYSSILQAIAGLLKLAENKAGGRLAVGIGTPGSLSSVNGRLRNSNTACLNGKPLLTDLQQTLQRPVRIENDANCFALSEAVDGAAAEYRMVFGVIIGTGCGGGLVWNGRLLSGAHHIAGEWGHNPLPWKKKFDVPRACYCGKQGCIETFLSGPGLAANTMALTGIQLNSREIVARAGQGDAGCQRMMENYFDQMARSLAHLINIIDPDAIVLGGGMSNIEQIYRVVPAKLNDYVFCDEVNTPILSPRYGDASGVRGAAWLWR